MNRGAITYSLTLAGASHRHAATRLCVATNAQDLGAALGEARSAYRHPGALLELFCSLYEQPIARELFDGVTWRHVATEALGSA